MFRNETRLSRLRGPGSNGLKRDRTFVERIKATGERLAARCFRGSKSPASTRHVCRALAAHQCALAIASGAKLARTGFGESVLLGQLAVDHRYQGGGYARSLMFFALTTAVRFSKQVGCFCVLTHPLDDGVRAFYRSFGFEDLPFDSALSMAVRIVDLPKNSLQCRIAFVLYMFHVNCRDSNGQRP